MRTPNTMMKNLISGVLSRYTTATFVQIKMYSGSGTLTESERAVLSLDVAGQYLNNGNTTNTEFIKTRQSAGIIASNSFIRASADNKVGLALSETTWTSQVVTGIDIGLMLVYIGANNASMLSSVLVLSVGEIGSGADVEMSSTLSSLNMIPAFGDLILNFL